LYYRVSVQTIKDQFVDGFVRALNVNERKPFPTKDDQKQIAQLLFPEYREHSGFMLGMSLRHFGTLRTMVDEWIDSGFDGEGREQPLDRRLTDECSDEYEYVEGTARPRRKSPTRSVVEECLERYPLRTDLLEHGGFQVVLELPQEDLDLGEKPHMPEMYAVNLFLGFYGSPWIFRLMRCAKCRTYQLVNAPRKSYVRGWHCAGCSKTAAATRSVSKARATLLESKLQACAAAWAKDKPRHANRVVWVLEQANKQLGWRSHIKRGFITRNLTEIQKRAERLVKAKV